MKKAPLYLLFTLMVLYSGCQRKPGYEIYYPLQNQTWDRFNFLLFEIPIEKSEGMYDVHLFARHTKAYEFDNLDFHMTMRTPSGEERIREYTMEVRKKDGSFTGNWTNDSCEISIPLKQDLRLTRGTLSIQLENVVPRLHLGGLLGVGIRVTPAGQ